jgi:hypothetical protein
MRPLSPTTPQSFIGADTLPLGVIVDRSSFDADDELGFSRDVPSAIDEERSLSDNGGVVMRNGKVKRKLRWKPPGFRRKKNNVSSNSSVISALTNRSTATNTSTSTTKSFLSHFSRKSQNSFHTFHSTATPVLKNSKQNPHTFQRPNYPDTFDTRQATIDNEGRCLHTSKILGSDRILETIDFERSSTLPSRLDSMPISPHSPMSESPAKFFEPFDDSSASLNSDAADALETSSPGPIKKPLKSKRPPLFKRRLKRKKGRPPSPAGTSHSSTNTFQSSPALENHTVPTLASSGSPLSASISVEPEESFLPVLDTEDYKENRRVAVHIGAPPRTKEDFTNQSAHEIDSVSTGALSSALNFASMSSTVSAGSSAKVGETASVGTPSRSGRRPKQAINARALSTPPKQSSSPSHRSSPRKGYNRPVDRTSSSPNDAGATLAEEAPSRRSCPTVPVDLDDGAFVEAEHNLRAIHDMAAEHLAHGEYEEALEVFEEILRGQQERYGKNHYRVGTALHNLGLVHMKSGNSEKAIEVCSQAVEVRKEALAPNHPDVVVSLTQLGVSHLENQSYDEALVASREALHIRRNILGPRHPKCAKILNNIGCALYAQDNFEEARVAFEEALDIQRDTLRMVPSSEGGQESTSALSNSILLGIASTLCNLGSIKLRWGQFEEAEVPLEEALLVSCIMLYFLRMVVCQET